MAFIRKPFNKFCANEIVLNFCMSIVDIEIERWSLKIASYYDPNGEAFYCPVGHRSTP